MADDFKLYTTEQWNAWWKNSYESSKSGKPSDNEVCDEFTQLSPMLDKHRESLFTSSTCNRVFVPLCGKSPDMKWLADQGQEVIGIECSEHAILGFFEENSIEYEKTVSPIDQNFNVFTGKSAKIVIFQGDFYKFGPDIAGGKFDGVWDTASLNTIDVAMRRKYVDVMQSLMKNDARYLLSGMFFGAKKTWKNNPFDITEDDMNELFGSFCSWELIDKDDTEWGLENVYLLKVLQK